MAARTRPSEPRPGDHSGADYSNIAELGCEVIGAVSPAASTPPNRDGGSFCRWIASGHRLEDWSSSMPPDYDFDPAA